MNRFYALIPIAAHSLQCAAVSNTNPGDINFSQLLAMLIVLGFFLLIVIAIFLICREVICWYFKINKIEKNQQEILRQLKELKEKTGIR